MSDSTAGAGFRQYARDVSRPFLALAAGLPVGAALVAVASRDVALLNVVHVTAGGLWAGATLYVATMLGPTLQGLDPADRGAVTVPLIPKNALLFGALLFATLLTGASLAGVLGLDNAAPVVVVAWLVGAVLLVLGVALIRFQGQVYEEVHGGEPDRQRVAALGARIGRYGLVMAAVQVLTLVAMGWLRVA